MKNAIRVMPAQYVSDEAFEKHLRIISDYSSVISEVALFTDYSHHGYWPLDEQKNLCEIINRRAAAYRKAGFVSVGLDVLNTVGHFDESWDVLAKPPMQTMVAKNGYITKSCLCPNTEEYREYIVERYRSFAATDVDFIWIDDDFRIDNHGHAGPCYCEGCINKFNRMYGRSVTREELGAAENSENSALSAEWTAFWRKCFTEVGKLISDAIKNVSKQMKIGMMTSPESASVMEWQFALDAVKGRPAGGLYYDTSPCDALFAMLRAEMQNVCYRNEITDRQYEFEAFPYPDYGKSRTIARLESALALMTGSNGIAYNLLNTVEVERTACRNTLDMIAEQYDFFSKISALAENTYNRGIYCTDTLNLGRQLLELGLPITADPRYASAVIITGHDVSRYDDSELEKLLSGAVLLDSTALSDVVSRGFGTLCGVLPGQTYDNGVYEIFTDDPVNCEYGGYQRNPYVNYMEWVIPTPVLEMQDDTVRVLSELYTIRGKRLGSCMTLYRNRFGGSVCVMSLIFADHCRRIQYYGKKVQLFSVFNEMIKSGLPFHINSLHKLSPIYRENSEGNWILMLANMSFDKCEKFTLNVNGRSVSRIMPDGSLSLTGEECGKETEITIEELVPWDIAVLCGKKC